MKLRFAVIKMKLPISIVILAFASNFIWLVVCVADPAKKPLTSTKDSTSSANSTLDLKNSTLSKDDDDKKNSTLKIDAKGTKPLGDNKNATTALKNDGAKNATMTEVGNAKAIHQPDLKLPSGKVIDSPKIGDKATTTSKPSKDKMMTTTERAKTRKDMKPSGADIPPIKLPNITGPIGKPTTESPKIPAKPDTFKTTTERAKASIVPPPNLRPVSPTAKVDEKSSKIPSSILPGAISKLPIGLIGEKLIPTTAATAATTTERAKLRKDLPGFNNASDAVDDAWKIVKDKKYDDLDKKQLPKYEIPVTDLEGLEGANATANNATDHPVLLKEAVAKEVKEAMDKFEEKHQKEVDQSKKDAEEDDSWSRWKIVALVLIPLFLVTFGIMLIIGIRQRMNVAKGRSVVYELTADMGKKNNEKPVIST